MHGNDPFEDLIDNKAPFKTYVLDDVEKQQWPDRIDYIAERIVDGQYTYGMKSGASEYIGDGYTLNSTAKEFYLEGIAALTGDRFRKTALPDSFNIGELLVQFAGLTRGLEDIDEGDLPPGELLARVLTRRVQRETTGDVSPIAEELRADIETPRELVAQLTALPEVASTVEESLPETDDPTSLRNELAELNLTTELWDHQLESLALWLYHGMNAYVDMATATGKTVLGLAAVAWSVDPGSLHPSDRLGLLDCLDDNVPDRPTRRPNRVLIVTTDELLGIQWANLFEEHCNTPEAFTKVDESGITLPWGTIETRSADSLADLDTQDYRLAIFDEVHNYTSQSGWGEGLKRFVESPCPVLALTGSVTRELRQLSAQTTTNFPLVYRYTHKRALEDGVIPDFEWNLTFTETAETEALEAFSDTAESFGRIVEYQDGQYQITPEALANETDVDASEREAIAGTYQSGSALAAGLRAPADNDTAPTESMETLASRIGNRTIHQLNLKPDLEQVLKLAKEALADGLPVLILTQSYLQAETLAELLKDDEVAVEYLTSGQEAATQDEIISRFDEHETRRKVLLGPGKRIGQGNDIHDVEVGINISRFGSGVNSTLVQRLGRLLRDPESKDTVTFHHVIGLPHRNAVIDPDAESFVRTTAEFFGQALEPDDEGILKPPGISIERPAVEDTILALETDGAPHVLSDETASLVEQSYAAAIKEAAGESVTVDSDWFNAIAGVNAPQVDAAAEGGETVSHTKGAQTTRDASTTATDDGPAATSMGGNKETPSPLVEHYEAFRSLGIIHRGIHQGSDVELDASDPFERWVADVRALLGGDGFGEQGQSYATQLEDEDLNIDAYRETFGDGMRVTDYQIVDVADPPAALQAFLIDDLDDLSTWVVPVAPASETPVPVFVENEGQLERGRALLRQFDLEPPLHAATVDDAATSDEDVATSEPSTATDQVDTSDSSPSGSNVAVEDVRGVSTSVAKTLRSAGYETMADLRAASDEELEAVEGVAAHRVTLIRACIGSK